MRLFALGLSCSLLISSATAWNHELKEADYTVTHTVTVLACPAPVLVTVTQPGLHCQEDSCSVDNGGNVGGHVTFEQSTTLPSEIVTVTHIQSGDLPRPSFAWSLTIATGSGTNSTPSRSTSSSYVATSSSGIRDTLTTSASFLSSTSTGVSGSSSASTFSSTFTGTQNIPALSSSIITGATSGFAVSATTDAIIASGISSGSASSSSSSESSASLLTSGTSTTVTTSTTLSSTSTTVSSVPAPTFYLQARSPASNLVNGYYAQVVSGVMQFTSISQSSASGFTIDSAGRLVNNGLYGQITPGTVSQVQFVSSASTKKRQLSSTLFCSVLADTTGAAILSCSASGQTIQQVCGTCYYIGSTSQCQPLIIGFVTPGMATGVSPSPSGTSSASFSLQSGSSNFYAVYTAGSGGTTVLAFSRFGNGAPFNLDGNGRLVSIGPTASGGIVPYVAVFPIGSTFGPVIEQTGAVPQQLVPIICSINTNPVTSIISLTCSDGATGTNMVLQNCQSSVLYLGTTIGTGCTLPTIRVRYGS